MKKLTLVIVAALLSFSFANAQDLVFGKKSQAINVGVGFGNSVLSGAYYSFAPSFSVSYEYGIVEVPMGSSLTGVVSVGGMVGFGFSNYKYLNWAEYHQYYVLVAARGNYHFIFHDKFDPYAGILLGYYFGNGKWKGDGTIPPDWNANTSSFQGGAYAGARWHFSDFFSVFSELGWSISIFTIGVTLQF